MPSGSFSFLFAFLYFLIFCMISLFSILNKGFRFEKKKVKLSLNDRVFLWNSARYLGIGYFLRYVRFTRKICDPKALRRGLF
jgi:hypothetical protein